MGLKFIYKNQFGRRSNKGVNSIKRDISISVFSNEVTGKTFVFTDVEILKYKRNKKINSFFDVYSNNEKFSLIEFGIPYLVTDKIERITQKIKRRCSNNGFNVLGFVWLFDIGEENFGAHYHLVIAIKRYNLKRYPDFLKIDFKKQSIHGSFVRNRVAFRRYLTGKDVFERGKRKRVFGNTRRFKEA